MRLDSEFKFIHAADLHLDSPFRIHEGKNDRLREVLLVAALKSFTKLCDFAIDEDVDFVILAGDVYDGIERGIRAQLWLQREFERLAGHNIQVFMAFGNHDPLDQKRQVAIKWPSNLKIFPGIPETFPLIKEGKYYGEITGVSFTNREEVRNLSLLFPNKHNSEIFQIAVMHSNVGEFSDHGNYAPASLIDLKSKGYDYWALGHIHKRTVLCDDPLILYPGNIQGLHLKPSERGVKGAELVSVSRGSLNHKCIPFAMVSFDQVELDVGQIESVDELIVKSVDSLIERYYQLGGVPLVAKLSFIGDPLDAIEKALSNPAEVQQVVEDQFETLKHEIYLDQLEVHCSSVKTLEDLCSLSDVVSELVREIKKVEIDLDNSSDVVIDLPLTKQIEVELKRLGLEEHLLLNPEDLINARRILSDLIVRSSVT